MFDHYPKTRPPLPEEYSSIYLRHYVSNRRGGTPATALSHRLEKWMHKQVAADVSRPPDTRKVTLELGAGILNHLRYEPAVRTYDIVEPSPGFYVKSPVLGRLRNIYADISEVPSANRYDRIISVATLEHICNLPGLVARCGLLLTETGVFRAAIPGEGTWLWTLGWKLTTGIEFRLRHGLDYGVLMKHEHVNTAKEIEEVLVYFFSKVRWKVLGLSRSVSFYRFYECHQPLKDRCESYLGLT